MTYRPSTWVVDASVAAKWFVPEEDSGLAMRLLQPHVRLIAPDLLYAELGSVFMKRLGRGDLSREQCSAAFRELAQMPVATEATACLTDTAYAIATETGRSVYDCLYLALAAIRDVPLVTEDLRLWNALQSTRHKDHVFRLSALFA
jgi:predicted nucleic acid-binding protein